jgi:hypothetical protein
MPYKHLYILIETTRRDKGNELLSTKNRNIRFAYVHITEELGHENRNMQENI